MDFSLSNLAATWKKWRQNMEFYLTAMMREKTEEEKYSVFLFLIGEQGRDIFKTIEWDKKVDTQGNQTEEDHITVWKNQHDDETFDQFMTELRNLGSTCEFGDLHESLMLYKVVDGVRSDKIRNVLLRKGDEATLQKAINIW